MIIRQPPPPGALDRYAVNLRPNPLGFTRGRRATRRAASAAAAKEAAAKRATIAVPGGTTPPLPPGGGLRSQTAGQAAAAAVKEYADVSAYRNILDMINTFEGVLDRFGKAIANELCCVGTQSRIQGNRMPDLNLFAEPKGYGNGDTSRIIIRKGSLQLATAIGYAAKSVGPQNKNEAQVYAQKMIQRAGLSCGSSVGFYEVPDLLNLARTINYEMNRVRLPIPHNFRQIANAIQGRDFRLCANWHQQIPGIPPKPDAQQWKYGGVRGRYFQQLDQIFSANYINAIELLQVYMDLKNSMRVMRTATRKEIDAANLARKVEEQTIRREQEALITRQQAEREAAEREQQILEEKRAAYEKEMEEAAKIAEEMAATKNELAAELQQLQAAREAAQTEEEVAAVEEKAAEVVSAAELANQMQQDMAVNYDTSRRAAVSLNEQIYQHQAQIPEGEPLPATKKPMNLTPIILTAAAGLLLT